MAEQRQTEFWDWLVRNPGSPEAPSNPDERVILALERLLPNPADPEMRARARRKILDNHPPTGAGLVMPGSLGTPAVAPPRVHAGTHPRTSAWRWAALAAALLLVFGGIGSWIAFDSTLLHSNQENGAVIPAIPDNSIDIPMRGANPGRTNVVPESAPRETPVDTWTYQTAGVVNTVPIVVDGMIYAGQSALSPQDPGTILALRASDGALVWSHPTIAGLTATFTEANGTLFAIDDNGNIYALDAASGVERWRVSLRGDQPYAFTYYGALLTVDGRLIVSTGSTISVAATNDAVYVVHPSPDWVEGDPHIYAISVDDGSVMWDAPGYPAGSQGGVFALSVDNGALLWNHDGTSAYLGPVVANGVVYYGEQNPATVIAVDAETGDELWRSPALGGDEWTGIASAAVTPDSVVTSTTTGDVISIDRQTGKLNWIVNVFYVATEVSITSPQIAVAGTTAIVTGNGAIAALDLTNHSIRWHLQIEINDQMSPVVVDGQIIQVALSQTSSKDMIVMLKSPADSP